MFLTILLLLSLQVVSVNCFSPFSPMLKNNKCYRKRTIQNFDTTQKDIDEIYKILNITTENIRKISDQISQLTGYNQNRDYELEKIIIDSFTRFLVNEEWDPITIEVNNFYYPNGTVWSEWDGVIYATHPRFKLPILFLIEVKQLFTSPKYNYFKKRVAYMETEILPNLDPKKKDLVGNFPVSKSYIEVARRVTRFTRKESFQVVGVVASPNIDEEVLKLLELDRASYMTLNNNDQYVVKFVNPNK
jgi:hypothetical protein